MSALRAAETIPSTPWASFVETNFPFFSSVVDGRKLGGGLPADNLTPRGLVLNLGQNCWAAFDTELLRVAAIWTGQALSPVSMAQISYLSPGTKAKEGEDILPQIMGAPWLANGLFPGWQAGVDFAPSDPRERAPDPKEIGRGPLTVEQGRFKAISLTRQGVRLEYEVAGATIHEWIRATEQAGQPVIQRDFRLERVPRRLWLSLGRAPDALADRLALVAASGPAEGGAPGWRLETKGDGWRVVRVDPSTRPLAFRVAMGLTTAVKTLDPPLAQAERPSPPRWPETITTKAVLAGSTNTFVVDNIALPLANPWKRNVRFADLAFFNDGRAAAVTFDGDVWLISGLRGDLDAVTWRRFTSGLQEPMSLCVRDDEVFVYDRNGIWRLRDTDGNGEADRHELFSNAFAQTAETREYVSSMKLAPDGSFVIAKGGIQMSALGKHNACVLRVSADGQKATVIGRGLRTSFLGVHPRTGLVTASDQQGNYVPTTPLHIIRDGRFYGFLSNLLPKERYPDAVADPLVWIPYPVNASGAAQVWLTDARMGPLNDALIHLGYYRPEVFVVRMNERGSRPQAAVLSLTRDLEFAPLNGVVNPVDGQLYLIGLQIWGTTAKQISGLARVRYAGGTSTFPREVVPMDKGILLRFDVPLAANSATDTANYSAERWNYARTFNYGSPHFKTDGGKGQDATPPRSAYLSNDGKTVFLGIPDMKPVMQMRVGWSLAARDGRRFEQNAYLTPYELSRFDPVAEGFEPLTVDFTPRTSVATTATPVTAEEGRRVAELFGCVACHSQDGSVLGKVGPSWKGLFGQERVFADGTRAKADAAYVRESILLPMAKVVRGFEKSETSMPSYEGVVSDAQIGALVKFIETLQ